MAHVPSPPALVVRPQESSFRWHEWTTLALFWLASVIAVAAAVWIWRERIPIGGSSELKTALDQNNALQQRVAVLERADQVARTANAALQREIRQQQEEVAGLRADLAFYSSLTSAGAQREGLNVQGLRLQPAATARMYNFTLTLTQNLKPGKIASGHVRINVSGLRANQLVTLDWRELAQNQDANGLPFSFKYFQQIKGTLLLPEAFTPNGVHVDVDGGAEQGKSDRDFAWTSVLADPGATDAGK